MMGKKNQKPKNKADKTVGRLLSCVTQMDDGNLHRGVITVGVPKQCFVLWKATAVQIREDTRSHQDASETFEYVTCTNDVRGLQRGCRWKRARAQ